MSEVKTYKLPPTKLVPNSPFPLLHYPRFFNLECDHITAADVYEIFSKTGWDTQWVVRYGDSQRSHYHSQVHECMVVLSGTASIRFGVADTDPDLQLNTHGPAREPGGVEVVAQVGDVFVIPAGVAHKTHDAVPQAPMKILTPGLARGIEAANVRETLLNIKLDGFTMMGAYPQGGVWDAAEGGEHIGSYDKVWSVPKPDHDPLFGHDDGVATLWKENSGTEP